MLEASQPVAAPSTTKFRSDYRPPVYFVESLDLEVDLFEENTRVIGTLTLRANPAREADWGTIVLDGVDLALVAVSLDGDELGPERYDVGPETLTVTGLGERAVLKTEVVIQPQNNTRFEGLYRSGPMFLTQCEAEGFRRITYSLDRPDVMMTCTTTVRAEKDKYPLLLSNGNCTDKGDGPDGRHWARWEDPFPKPSYLFALVAGDLHVERDRFVTMSGREITLDLFAEHHHSDKCRHALDSLIRSMKWDEDEFGREYDLDLYMIVATDHFNMGAMENKGLNVFNSKFVLASPKTATDADYERIEAVVAHEYFHNWTGNRVTCRDWFQLTLKEGLTVFRDQQYTADQTSAAVKRIQDVMELRRRQFPEDAGPMAHPVRPESYQEMNNFYTATVYSKGAEVVRMYQTLLGRDGFRRGMDLYFERHDGEAVTCDDFRSAMADSNERDLSQFEQWYLQAGTPVLEVHETHDADTDRRSLTFRQSNPTASGGEPVPPLHIPVAFGIIGEDGQDLPLRLVSESKPEGSNRVLELTEAEQTFVFEGVPEGAVTSCLRGFSAPVELRAERSLEQYAFQMAHDSDSFNRWEAGQQFASKLLLEMIAQEQQGRVVALDERFVEAWGKVLCNEALDPALVSLALSLPGESYLAEKLDVIDPGAIHRVRTRALAQLAQAHADSLVRVRQAHLSDEPYRSDQASVGARRLANTCLALLMRTDRPDALEACVEHARGADNMTDSVAALASLCDREDEVRQPALDAFYDRWKHETLVLDKWFTLQAMSDRDDTVEWVGRLGEHADFDLKNPNRVRSLLSGFCVMNPAHFHREDGAGYRLLTDYLLKLDAINPQVTSRLIDPLLTWRRIEPKRRALMKEQLERVAAHRELSKDVGEKVGKALEG